MWWAIDLLLILFGKFKDADGVLLGQSGTSAQSNVSSPPSLGMPPSLPSSANEADWLMQAKPTPSWKFILGANLAKSYQLNFVEKRGDYITVAVLSGKKCVFKLGEFNGKYYKTKQGNRDFIFKSTVGPKQKIVFRETLLQMPERWWDELEVKLNASELGWSKVLNATNKALGNANDLMGN